MKSKYSRVSNVKELKKLSEYQNELIWSVAELMDKLQANLKAAIEETERIQKATEQYDKMLEKINEKL